ncbi:MAG: T9SS type A sorting domain-containing protein [Saprospiraceae bacterium]|nr:T9SS type A sorting domain-containing protein [Saprospiraceae bacterium]MCF8250780.1 T9SS type A sorting domain-containing protein [Saprospiraceae bacterium]MCF8281758.1 T9SS type A sorting domain-containing protein [Bacteroidales bacterium]MCF8312581.1 T9SS type A sorting domain-containing protein [Saprospiraceae bacterium]MCF8440910.1 T9SS type A sorting domain-containing protein [Saprospiraceae bacterium]
MKSSFFYSFSLGTILLVFAFMGGQKLNAATCTWIGGTSNWNNTANWNCGVVPDSDDDVIINTGTVTLDLATTVQSLSLGGGDITLNFNLTVSGNMSLTNGSSEINGNGNLTITGNLTWDAGKIGGAGLFSLTGTMTGSGANPILNTRSLTLTEGGTWTNQTFNLESGASITIPMGKTLTIDNSGSESLDGPTNNGGTLINNGTIEKNGAGTFNITDNELDNNGDININVGSFSFSSRSVSTHDNGNVTIGAGTSLNFNGNPTTNTFTNTVITNNGAFILGQTNATVTINAGTSLNNDISQTGGNLILNEPQIFANLSMTAGTITLNSDLTVSNELSMTGGSGKLIDGDGDLTISGTFTWTIGTIKGTGAITVDGTLNSTGGFSFLETRTMTLNAGGNMTTHSYSLKNNAKFIIPAGQTLTIDNNTGSAKSFTASNGNFGTIENNGTIIKTGSGSLEVLYNTVDNNGTMNINAGTWLFSSASVSTHDFATVSIASGALMECRGTSHVFNSTSISGAGVFKLNIPNQSVSINTGCTFSVATEMNSGTLNLSVAAIIPSLSMYAGTSDLVLNNSLSVAGDVSMTSNNAEISGPGDLTINGNLNWDNGTISGAGDLTLNGFFTGNNGQSATLDTRDLILNAGGSWTDYDFDLFNGASLTIPANQTLTINNVSLKSTAGTAANKGAIINNGTIAKNGAGEYAISNNSLDNNGVININAGMVSLGTGSSSTHDGTTITIAIGAELELGGSLTHTFDNTAINGAGTFSKAASSTVTLNIGTTITTHVYAGSSGNTSLIFNIPATIPTLTISSSMVVLNANLTVTGNAEFNDGNTPDGGISGNGDLTINGNLHWKGGQVSGNGTFTLGGTLTVDNNNIILDTRSLSLTSGGTMSSSLIVFAQSNGAILTIPVGQTLTLNSGGSVYIRDENLINHGTIEKTGTGAGILGANLFTNDGQINITGGSLRIGESNGEESNHDNAVFTISAGSELLFYGVGNMHNLDNTSISGPGMLSIEGGSIVNLNAGTTITNIPVQISVATLNLNINTTFNSLFSVNYQTILSGTFTTLNITGDVDWDGSMTPANPATINVGGAFLLNFTGSQTTFSNTTLNLNGGGTWTRASCTMKDNAEFIVSSGQTLTIDNTSNSTLLNGTGGGGILTNNGNLIKSGTAIFNIDVPYSTASGSITDIQAGTLDFNNTFNNSGTVKGIATINTAGVTGSPSYGIFSPGTSPGTLTVTGNYTNTTLDIEIEAGSPVLFDKLVVSGTATLGGTLNVTETGNVPAGSYTILSAASISGSFSTMNLPDCYTIQISGGNVNLIHGVGKVWDGSTGTWSTATSWIPNGVPCPQDDVVINSGVCNLNEQPTMTSLTITGGEMVKVDATTYTIDAPFTIEAGGALNLQAGVLDVNDVFDNDGIVDGIGTIDLEDATVILPTGHWSPGNSAGTLTVKGTHTNEVMSIEIGENGGNVELDLLETTQNLTVGGDLNILYMYGTVPAGTRTIAECGGGSGCRTGTFATVNFPPECQGGCNIIYEPTMVRLENTVPIEFVGTCTWLGGTGNWTEPLNWSCNNVPNGNDDVVINSGVVTLNAPVTVNSLVFSGGAISGSSLTVTGSFTWSGGTFGTNGINNVGAMELSGSPTLANGTLSLNGGGSWTNANLTLSNNAILKIPTGTALTLNITTASGITQSGTSAFQNVGTLLKNGTALFTINVPYTSTGFTNIAQGVLQFLNSFNNTGGTVMGVGTLDLANANIVEYGIFSPGSSPGTLYLEGDYINSTLIIEIAESGGFVEHDLLEVSQDAMPGNNLVITHLGGVIPYGDYTFLHCNSGSNCLEGTFDPVTFPSFCQGECSIIYTGGSATLRYAAPLPIELLWFKGAWENKSVKLEWETASESDNERYVILRSTNGRDWQKLGSVPGNGTTTERHEYEFLDNVPMRGVNYYRLQIVSIAGEIEYSKTISVSAHGLPWRAYPNPVNGLLRVDFPDIAEGKLLLFDWTGRLVLNELVNNQPSVELDLSSLPEGVYWLCLDNGDGQVIVKQ